MKPLLVLTGLLLSAAAAGATPVGIAPDESHSSGPRLDGPIAVQMVSARRLDDRHVGMTLRVWSTTLNPVFAGIPAAYRGWRLTTVDGQVTTAAAFRTPNRDPVVSTGAQGHNTFVVRYAEPVTVPVWVERSPASIGAATVDVTLLVCGIGHCSPQQFRFGHVNFDQGATQG